MKRKFWSYILGLRFVTTLLTLSLFIHLSLGLRKEGYDLDEWIFWGV